MQAMNLSCEILGMLASLVPLITAELMFLVCKFAVDIYVFIT